jgi:hypothetical protein
MSTSSAGMIQGFPPAARSVWQAGGAGNWWSQRREASLNWLALGLLLAAWNASDDGQEVPAAQRPTAQRPSALRGYSSVSVRAATLHAEELQREFLSKGHTTVNVL